MDGRQEVTVGWGQGAGWGRLQDSVSPGALSCGGSTPQSLGRRGRVQLCSEPRSWASPSGRRALGVPGVTEGPEGPWSVRSSPFQSNDEIQQENGHTAGAGAGDRIIHRVELFSLHLKFPVSQCVLPAGPAAPWPDPLPGPKKDFK